jgi:hypothetical protein
LGAVREFSDLPEDVSGKSKVLARQRELIGALESRPSVRRAH